jgi:alkanesulfonate monooxygenase SsuD/methylene tetrahydromethanopterin reductase-like flavin-dependent oxidoreductase (luciferase family)
MTGAVAAATSRVKVGTWVLSALHRNPGITAKAVETLDEISAGRFVLGLGSGHAGRQAHAFGLPEDHVQGRFADAVEIIVPLLRRGHADFEGTFHAARDLEHRPVGPRPGGIPIMIGAKGPRMLRLAATHADTWSWYVQERSDLEEFGPQLESLEAMCAEVGRDPATIGKSAGIVVEPTSVTGAADVLAEPLRGPADFGGKTFADVLVEVKRHRTLDLLRIRPPAEALMFYRAIAGLGQNLHALRARLDLRPFFADRPVRVDDP